MELSGLTSKRLSRHQLLVNRLGTIKLFNQNLSTCVLLVTD